MIKVSKGIENPDIRESTLTGGIVIFPICCKKCQLFPGKWMKLWFIRDIETDLAKQTGLVVPEVILPVIGVASDWCSHHF